MQSVSKYSYLHITNTTGKMHKPGPSQLIFSSWGKGVNVEAVEIPHKLNSPLSLLQDVRGYQYQEHELIV